MIKKYLNTKLVTIEKRVISIVLTTSCNQNCIMCPQRLNEETTDYEETIKSIINLIRKERFREIYITGGEPFLKKDVIDEIALSAKEYSRIIILTNGSIFPTETILKSKKVTLCIPLYASYDSLHNEISGSQNFYQVIQNLIRISTYKMPIELRFVITKKNYKNIPSFAEFIYRNLPFVSNIAFMGIELMEKGFKNKDDLWIDPAEFTPYLYKGLDYLLSFDMPVSLYNFPSCIIDNRYHNLLFKSISKWKRKYLSFCNKCKYRYNCGGFFVSDFEKYSTLIKGPIK